MTVVLLSFSASSSAPNDSLKVTSNWKSLRPPAVTSWANGVWLALACRLGRQPEWWPCLHGVKSPVTGAKALAELLCPDATKRIFDDALVLWDPANEETALDDSFALV